MTDADRVNSFVASVNWASVLACNLILSIFVIGRLVVAFIR
jgi:hypothetical protein